MKYMLKDICRRIGISYEGSDIRIKALKTLEDAEEGDLSFFHSSKYLKSLPHTRASAVLIESRYADRLPSGTIPLLTDEPYLKLAYASELFAHPVSAECHEPEISEECDISPEARFGKNVHIGARSVIMAGAYLGDNAKVGSDCIIYPNAVLYHGTTVGDRCIIHSGAVLGSDGYGFAHTRDGRHVKIYQIGNTVIEDDVEIGANTTIDRGALGDTVIGRGTKIDNLVQIGHNCRLGENCLVVAQVGLGGSTETGRNVVFGGQSATAGHLKIGDFATFAARSGIIKSVEGGKTYAGMPITDIKAWRKLQAALARLAKGKKIL